MNQAAVICIVLLGVFFLSVCDNGKVVGNPPRWPPGPVNPGCGLEHVVAGGETQWTVAARYAGSQDKHLWLRRMRWASHLATDDDHLYPGQVLCVAW